MGIRSILGGFLFCVGTQAGAQAGDNECVIVFYLGKVGIDGVCTTIMDCLTWPINEATVQLAPGEQVRLTRHSPGYTQCPTSQVGLERHVGTGPGYASLTDPVLDTLSFTWPETDLSEPGSYYLRGVAPNYGLYYYAASLKLIIENSATVMAEVGSSSFHAWPVRGGLAFEHAPAGTLTVMDLMGKPVCDIRIALNSGVQTVSLPDMPTGNYILLLNSDAGPVRRRIMML
jgi:hypothetical protein